MDRYCAWCGNEIRHDPVTDHGVGYHAACFAHRRTVFGPEPADSDGKPEKES